jgi:DNA repair protein RadD
MQLRPYQTAAVNAIIEYWCNQGGNALVEMATGCGKSLVLAKLNQHLLQHYPMMRVLLLVHVRELVRQDYDELRALWPDAPAGINSAGLNRRDTNSQILLASIQSVYRRGSELGRRDIVMIDEAHLVPRSGEGMYRTLLEKLRETTPDLRVCGLTATPYRLDTGRLDEGDGRLFDDLVYSYGIAHGVADGYLSPLIAFQGAKQIDVSGVHKVAGEYNTKELEDAANGAEIVNSACDEMIRRGQDRKSWLVFCCGIKHAAHVTGVLRDRGVSVAMVTGETPLGERDGIFAAFKAGQIRALCGCQVFTTGFNAPNVDMIVLLRPTLSTSLYVQMLGRGTRKANGKKNCTVLDFSGNIRRHGPVDNLDIKVKKPGDPTEPKEPPQKICPQCQAFCHAALLECWSCGFEFPKNEEPKHEARASVDVPVMTSELTDKWIDVIDVVLDVHHKPDSPDSLKVQYECGISVYREWICLEHRGYAGKKARAWWRAMGGRIPAPMTVQDALARARELAIAKAIKVQPEGQYWRIAGYRFEQDGVVFEVNDRFQTRMVEMA